MAHTNGFADADDMVARWDESLLRDLCSDGDTPAIDLSTDPKMLAALKSTAGMIEAAAYNSANYTDEEFTDLETANGHGWALLVDLNCCLAMGRLMRRRPGRVADDTTKGIIEEAEGYLDKLRNGTRIFPITAHEQKGAPTINGPTGMDYERLNLITSRTRNFYPSQASRLPIGRG